MFQSKQIPISLLALLFVSLASGCMTMPTYKSMEDDQQGNSSSSVMYKVDPIMAYKGLECLVIMPLAIGPDAHDVISFSQTGADSDSTESHLYDMQLDGNDKQQLLRKLLYGQIAPHSARDIELTQVDRWAHAGDPNPDYERLSRKFSCPWFLEGELTRFSADYFGVYSNIVVAADMQIINGKDRKIIWQGHHEAEVVTAVYR